MANAKDVVKANLSSMLCFHALLLSESVREFQLLISRQKTLSDLLLSCFKHAQA